MQLSTLAHTLEKQFLTETLKLRLGNSADDPDIERACFDSREVRDGDLYCAVGREPSRIWEFAEEAFQKGAVALFGPEFPGPPESVRHLPGLFCQTQTPVASLAGWAAATLAGNPAREMWLAGVTGTNGKTTVAQLLQECMTTATVPTGRSGTLGLYFAGRTHELGNTTPPADVLHHWLRKILQAGARAAVLEASSHGIHQHRLSGLEFDVVGWTNLSQDHLDYHRDLNDYAAAKARLVLDLRSDAIAFLPAAEQPGTDLIAEVCRGTRARIVRWGLSSATSPQPSLDLWAKATWEEERLCLDVQGEWGHVEIRSPLVGEHNAENLLLAYGMARAAGLQAEEAAKGLNQVAPAPGRLQPVALDSPWLLFVDYAHTPDALERALGALRQAYPDRRLGVVFGAGGNRDPLKRPFMGEAAARGADWCLITNDNPRNEDPQVIAAAVAEGVRAAGVPVEIELDRRKAIRSAVGRLQAGDVLLVAGKGHEPYQEVRGVRHSFDDRVELEAAAQCWA